MLFSVSFGVPEKSVFTRLFFVFATDMLANFQDRLVMTASITLRRLSFAKALHYGSEDIISQERGKVKPQSEKSSF